MIKKGLGRGLNALFGVFDEEVVEFQGQGPALVAHEENALFHKIINAQAIGVIFVNGVGGLLLVQTLLAEPEDIALLVDIGFDFVVH